MASRRPLKLSAPDNRFSKYRVGIAVALWHSDITEPLLKGALKVLKECGISEASVIIKEVPGSFELPLGAQWLIENNKVDAVLCLGCIIKGETPHFDYISEAVANGIMQLNLKYNKPFIFGVLTTNNLKQAKERSGGKHGNKGSEAAITSLEMLNNKK